MTFASAQTNISPAEAFGRTRVVFGTWSNNYGTSGGTIATGLTKVNYASLDETGSIATSNSIIADTSFPVTSATLTVTCLANTTLTGVWLAIGE